MEPDLQEANGRAVESCIEQEIISPQVAPAKISHRRSFAADVAKLVSGAALAQGIGIALAPLIARLYSPDDFGIAAVFASVAGIVSVVACMRYEQAIMLPERDEDAVNLLAVSLLAALLVSGVTLILVAVIRQPLARLLNTPDLASFFWLVPLAVFVYGLSLTFYQWIIRRKRFGVLSLAQVSESTLVYGSQLVTGWIGDVGAGELILTRVFGSAVVAIGLGIRAWLDKQRSILLSVRWSTLLTWARRYRKFPLYSSWAEVLFTASWHIPTLLLSYFFSSAVVGYYSLASRILLLPVTTVGVAIGRVFFQRAAEAQNLNDGVSDVVLTSFRWLVACGLFPSLLLAVIGRELFIVVFGAPWSEAGVYVQIMALWIFLLFISGPLTTLFSVLERQGTGLVFNALVFLSRLAALALGGAFGSPRLTIALFAGSGLVIYGGLCVWILQASKVLPSVAFAILGKYLGLGLGLLIPIALMKHFAVVHSTTLLVTSVVISGIYGLVLLHQEPRLVERLRLWINSR